MDTVTDHDMRYEDRIHAIVARIQDMGRALAIADLDVVVERGAKAPTRTAHTVRLCHGTQETILLLSREEFFNEFDLFDRAAVPRLRAAIGRLGTPESAAGR